MRYYFAPLEGLTDSIFRRLHSQYFPGIDKYFTPFFSPTIHRALTPKEKREMPPADTLSYACVPQILTKNAEDFLWLAEQCAALGYKEVNLNLGCPSGTVTAKGKGAGMLRDLDVLDAFLEAVYSKAALPISVKTRIGFENPDEFPQLLEIFNQYPIAELTVHPRTRTAFYKGDVNIEMFNYAVANSKNPLCYNGNLNTIDDIEKFSKNYPQIDSVMLGRGLIGDPGMLTKSGSDAKTLSAFYSALMEAYTENFGSSRNAMFRLKENWSYLICRFDGGEKLYKKLRKSTDVAEFNAITDEIFKTIPLKTELLPNW